MTDVKPAPSTASFRLERAGHELVFRTARLSHREWITPGYVRIRLEGEQLRGFDSPGADDHIRVFFPGAAATTAADPLSVDELRAAPSREYTPVAWDAEAGRLDLEFVLHGSGVGGTWAANAPLGSVAGVGGPRGSQLLTGRPEGWLLAGDETAVPAMRRFAAQMDAGAAGLILVETAGADHELPIAAPAGVRVEQVHRGSAPAGVALAARLDALGTDDRPAPSTFAFIAAEQAIVRPGRALLLDRWGLDPDSVIVKGYWKQGETEYHAPH